MEIKNNARREDCRFLTGSGRFIADRITERTLYAGFYRSEIAHGILLSIDVEKARCGGDVVAVLTSEDLHTEGIGPIDHIDLPRDDGGPAVTYPQPLLNDSLIRHVGEPLVLIVAKSRPALADALEAVDVRIETAEPLRGVAFCRRLGEFETVAGSFARARYQTVTEIAVPRMTASALEPRGGIACALPDGSLHYKTSTQSPFAVRDQIASHFGWDPKTVRVEAGDVGGSFGLKGYMTREDALLCWAAKRLDAEVAWFSTRSEAILSDAQGRGVTGKVHLAFDEGLKLLALKASFDIDVGAYPGRRAFGLVNNSNGLTGVYDVPAAAVEIFGRLSARAPLAPFRGNGRPEATYAIERALDQAAREIDCDPVELRRRNLITPDCMPYRTALSVQIDCGDFPKVMASALELADGAAERRSDAIARGKLFGTGLANCVESAGGPVRKPRPDFASLTVHPDGRITVAPGVMSVGQGHESGLTKMVAARLQIEPARIEYMQGDTDALSAGRGSGGSSGLTVGGSALSVALDDLLEEGRQGAAAMMACPSEQLDYRDGAFFRRGSNEHIPIGVLSSRDGKSWTVESSFTPMSATFPNGTHICEVEIDPETGHIEITRYVAVEDVGRVINPVLVDGQMHGGIAQGLSLGLGEAIAYDDAGQILTGSLMDYAIARAADLPVFQVASVEVPTDLNPLGVKGVGEAGTVGSTAAFALAVSDAMARAGIEDFQPPATPARVWEALHSDGIATRS